MYIIVAGGGMVGGSLVEKLMENKHDVVMIEKDKELCEKLYAKTGVVAINGNSNQIDVLKAAGIEKADVFVGAIDYDADNLAAAMLAKSFGVPEIIVRMRDLGFENAYKIAGVNTILRVTDLMVNQMLMEIEKPEVKKITTIGSGNVAIYRIEIPKNSRVIGQSIKDITTDSKFPPQCAFVAVFKKQNDQFTIPKGSQLIERYDVLFLISPAEHIKAASDFLTKAGKIKEEQLVSVANERMEYTKAAELD